MVYFVCLWRVPQWAETPRGQRSHAPVTLVRPPPFPPPPPDRGPAPLAMLPRSVLMGWRCGAPAHMAPHAGGRWYRASRALLGVRRPCLAAACRDGRMGRPKWRHLNSCNGAGDCSCRQRGGDWNLIKTVQQSRDTPCEEEHATIVGAHEDPP